MARGRDPSRLDAVVAQARRDREQREAGYRHKALTLFPWVCGRCARSFDRSNLIELTVHHRDHNHDNNPDDGSNWELLCRWCHDNEHQRVTGEHDATGTSTVDAATHQPFADLAKALRRGD
ncbi:MAG: YajD family HNH nuclease [Pseudomonadota bacterium]